MVRAVVRRSGNAVGCVGPCALAHGVGVMLAGLLASSAAHALEPAMAEGIARFAHIARAASQESIVPGHKKSVEMPPPVRTPAADATADAMPAVAPGDKVAAASASASPAAIKYEPVEYAALPGWADDDHLAALKAFAKSCERIHAAARAGNKPGSTPPPTLRRRGRRRR